MKKFKVKLVSQTNAIALLTILCVSFLFEATIFFPIQNKMLAFILLLTEFGVAIFLWRRFVTGRAEFSVNSNEIVITWIKEFPFSKIGSIVLRWNEIKKVWQGADTNYYSLKFRLTSGETITFYHDNLVTNDDFEDLEYAIYQRFEEQKKLKTTESIIITEKGD